MEYFNRPPESLISAHDELRSIIDEENNIDYITYSFLRHCSKTDSYKANIHQMERMARIMGLVNNTSERTMQNSFEGQVMAFQVLERMHIDHFDDRVYTALNQVYNYARRVARGELIDNNNDNDAAREPSTTSVGIVIRDMLDKNPSFIAMNEKEESLFKDLFEEGDEDDYYDTARGYRLVRMALAWSEPKSHNSELSDQARDEFARIVETMTLDPRPMDDLLSCDSEVAAINTVSANLIDEFFRPEQSSSKESSEDDYRSLIDELQSHFINIEGFGAGSTITAIGNFAVLVGYSDGGETQPLVVPESSTLRGTIDGISIHPIPSQSYVDQKIIGRKLDDDQLLYSPALILSKVTIAQTNGTIVQPIPDQSFYLPTTYKDVHFWYDPTTRNN